MNLSEEAAFDCVKTLADATFRHQGEFVCLLAQYRAGIHRHELSPTAVSSRVRLLGEIDGRLLTHSLFLELPVFYVRFDGHRRVSSIDQCFRGFACLVEA
jgi:hypothetical protein